MRAQREVVVLLAGESRQVEHDDELHSALVRTTELQELLKFGAIGGLRALAFFAESRDDLEALTLAVFLAGLQLRGQTQILGLLFRADADVDDSTDHWPQLRPVRSRRQGDLAVHRLMRSAVVEKQFNHDASDDICMLAHAINFLVCQIDAVVLQQLATALDPGLIDVGRSDLVHRFPHRISPGHHVSAVPGSTEVPGQGRQPAKRVERSESLDRAEASPRIEHVMAPLS